MNELEDTLLGIAEVLLKKVHASLMKRKKKHKTFTHDIRLLEVAVSNIELMRVHVKV